MEKVLALHGDDVLSETDSWIKGVEGEQETARYLGLLGPEWKVIHAIPVGTSGKDLDHLVIGPTGVFVINSKNHPSANALVSGGKIIIGRQPWSEPASAFKDANHVADILSSAVGFPVPTTGVVSLVGVKRITIGDEYPVATVLHSRGLAKMIRQARPNQGLNESQVELLYSVATQASTWGCTQQHDPEYISSKYDSLIASLNSVPYEVGTKSQPKLSPNFNSRRRSPSQRRTNEVRRKLSTVETSTKSPVIALALLIFFGFFGMHRLYVGKYKLGWASLLLLVLAGRNHSFSSIYIPAAFVLLIIEFLLVVSSTYTDGQGKVLRFRARRIQGIEKN